MYPEPDGGIRNDPLRFRLYRRERDRVGTRGRIGHRDRDGQGHRRDSLVFL